MEGTHSRKYSLAHRELSEAHTSQSHCPKEATCALQTKGSLSLQHIILSTDISCLKHNPKNYVEVEYSGEREHSLLNTA